MPLQNRVQPTGEIIADPARGTFTGNRGIIHRDDRRLGTSRWSHHAWICCVLEWQGRKRPVMSGRNWTELFFLDEAVAMAAGHRPCGYCRRKDYARFGEAWQVATGQPASAKEMDRKLHAARIIRGTRQQRRYEAPIDRLPSGAMIMHDGDPCLVSSDALHPYQRHSYGAAIKRPRSSLVTVLTPEPMIDVLRAGFAPHIHPSAGLSDPASR